MAGLNKTIISVKKGSGFNQISDTEFEIDPLSKEDTNKVIDHLISRVKFQGIINAWAFDLPSNDELNENSIIKAEYLI